MKLTEAQRRTLETIKDSPWRLYETDRDVAALVRTGLISASDHWSDGSALYDITPAGRAALREGGE